jgi:hypothetical protein
MRPDPGRSRREIADYLRAQAAPLQRANEAQKLWGKQLPQLFESVNDGKGAVAAIRARSLGKQYGTLFREVLAQVEKLTPPQAAIRCQEYMSRWLKALINASDSLLHAPEDGKDIAYLRDCNDYLDDARYAAKPLTEIRQKLYDVVKGGSASAPKS